MFTANDPPETTLIIRIQKVGNEWSLITSNETTPLSCTGFESGLIACLESTGGTEIGKYYGSILLDSDSGLMIQNIYLH